MSVRNECITDLYGEHGLPVRTMDEAIKSLENIYLVLYKTDSQKNLGEYLFRHIDLIQLNDKSSVGDKYKIVEKCNKKQAFDYFYHINRVRNYDLYIRITPIFFNVVNDITSNILYDDDVSDIDDRFFSSYLSARIVSAILEEIRRGGLSRPLKREIYHRFNDLLLRSEMGMHKAHEDRKNHLETKA